MKVSVTLSTERIFRKITCLQIENQIKICFDEHLRHLILLLYPVPITVPLG